MKIKIIDLLNKIANGEESINVETKYDSDDWEKDDFLLSLYKEFEHKNNYEIVEFLNDYVEIIEEPKKIEKLDVALLGQCDNWLRCPTNKETKQDVELNPYIIDNIRENTLYFQRKINELIDEVNELKRDK